MQISLIQALNDCNILKLCMEYFGAHHLHSSLTLTHQMDSYLAHG